jgi:hypothetical protein
MLYKKTKERLLNVLIVSLVICGFVIIPLGVNFVYLWFAKLVVGPQQPGNNARLVLDVSVTAILAILFFYIFYNRIKDLFRK